MDLTRFWRINEPTSTTWEEQNKKRNDVARRILQSVFAFRLRRINADRSYEPSLFLRTFASAPPTTSLDLSLDWLKLVYEKEKIPTPQDWEEILWPALLDVKHTISEMIASHRVHLFVKSILPVAIALGFVFRETTRMTLLLEGQKETWSTEACPSEKEPLRKEWIYNDQEDQEEVEVVKEKDAVVIEVEKVVAMEDEEDAVAVKKEEDAVVIEGEKAVAMDDEEDSVAFDEEEDAVVKVAVVEVAMSRSTKQSVVEALSAMNLLPIYHIRLEAPEFSRESVRDAAHAQQVGRVCQELCDERGVRHLHLFVAIPVELAVLIGHQLNALCPITLYEFKSDKRAYIPFCTLL
jgi:hypothetical protein